MEFSCMGKGEFPNLRVGWWHKVQGMKPFCFIIKGETESLRGGVAELGGLTPSPVPLLPPQ